MSIEMRIYVAKAITNTGREIKCAKCGTLTGLEFHHKKYEEANIDDIEILCHKCHRNAKKSTNKSSLLSTVYEKGKRYCVVNYCKFAY